jgi:hypothetical protein
LHIESGREIHSLPQLLKERIEMKNAFTVSIKNARSGKVELKNGLRLIGSDGKKGEIVFCNKGYFLKVAKFLLPLQNDFSLEYLKIISYILKKGSYAEYKSVN